MSYPYKGRPQEGDNFMDIVAVGVFHTTVGSNHRQRKDQFKKLPKTSMYKWLATNWMISQNLYIKKMLGNWGTKKITKLQKNPSIRRKIVVLDFVGTKGTAGRKRSAGRCHGFVGFV